MTYVAKLLLVAAVAAFAGGAHAAPIPIANASFEDAGARGDLSDGEFVIGAIPNWTIGFEGSPNVGYQDPTTTVFPSVPDVENVAFVGTGVSGGVPFAGRFEQTLDERVRANTRYTLSTDVGRRGDGIALADFAVEIFAGNAILASGTLGGTELVAGQFRTLVVEYLSTTSLDAFLGIRVRALYDAAQGGEYRQTNFDDFRFEAVDAGPVGVPEPGGLALVALGLVGLSAVARRRRA